MQIRFRKHIELYIILLIFIILFVLPVLFTRVNGEISWRYVLKLWQDLLLLIPIFVINHWFLAPKLMLRRRFFGYLISIFGIIAISSFSYYYYDEVINPKPRKIEIVQVKNPNPAPTPIPPYAHLLMYSLLIVGVDTGLLFSKKWNENEEKKHLLEKENAEMQLDLLRNQISPHFFMNTLNNIHALIEYDKEIAKNSVVKLSQLMRVLLYENEKYTLQNEIKFIKDYLDLMKIRVNENVEIKFEYPEVIPELNLPPLLFISFVENSFKHGIMAMGNSFIYIKFELENNLLNVLITNGKTNNSINKIVGGKIGMNNSKKRFDLIYNKDYSYVVNETETTYEVNVKVPLYEN